MSVRIRDIQSNNWQVTEYSTGSRPNTISSARKDPLYPIRPDAECDIRPDSGYTNAFLIYAFLL